MTNVEPWERLVEAESTYTATRLELIAADSESQLRLALASPRGRGAALRILLDAPIGLVAAMLDTVFVAATTTHPQVGVARQVLGRLDHPWLSAAMRPMVEEKLSTGAATWEDFRRLAELLEFLVQRALLDDVLETASASKDANAREVAADFRGR